MLYLFSLFPIHFFLSFFFNSVTGEICNNLTDAVFTTLNIIFKQVRLGSTVNAGDITFYFSKYKVKFILILHTDKG